MKTTIKIVVLFLTLFIARADKVNAQDQCGVYLNAEDFFKGKLSHSGKHTKIKTHETFKKDFIEVKFNDSTLTFKKKDVYGYSDKEGQCYRFFDAEIYPILNPSESIILYKRTSGMGTKNSKIVETYYFSKDVSSPVTSLTLRNIEKAFADNEAFLKILETHFSEQSNLLEYDNIHKKYKLNRLLELANEKKTN